MEFIKYVHLKELKSLESYGKNDDNSDDLSTSPSMSTIEAMVIVQVGNDKDKGI